MVAIIGANGSMGRRYSAIFKYLGIKYDGYDINDDYRNIKHDRIVICTPTFSHANVLNQLVRENCNILIEKPMFESEDEYLAQYAGDLRVVCNYKFIDSSSSGESTYSYYDCGKEALWANLIQLVGLARNGFTYHPLSPVWKCTLNGKKLTLEDVQASYVTMVELWLKDPRYLIDKEGAHKWYLKAKAWELEYKHA